MRRAGDVDCGLNSANAVPLMAPIMDRRRTTLFGSVIVGFFATALVGCASTAESRPSFDPGATDPAEGDQPGDGMGDGSGTATTTPPAQKPACGSGQYTETLPSASASLSGLSFSSSTANDFVLKALAKRYPIGKQIVEGGLSSPLAEQQGNCIDRFLQDRSSEDGALRGVSTVVHECGHLYDLGDAQGSDSTYYVRPDLKFTCKSGDTTDRGGKTFARSLLRGDEYDSKRQACGGRSMPGCDSYADVYLDGSATDSTFQSGDQGYNSVLEEANQYVNSLATAYAFQDAYTDMKTSDRDGILTFLWYIERYLKLAHDKYPAAYALLAQDKCWREATLSVWDRGWFYLKTTQGMDSLGMDDAALTTLVKDSSLNAEIDALRKLECQ